MKINILLIVLTVTASVFAFSFMHDHTPEESPLEIAQNKYSVDEVSAKNKDLSSELTQSWQSNPSQDEVLQTMQSRLNEMLAKFEIRLSALESDNDHHNKISEIDASGNVAVKNDTSDPVINTTVGQVSNKDLSDWIDDSLVVGANWDADSTALATEQTITSIAEAANIHLEDLQCSNKVCRAIFREDNNDDQAVSDLFGTPPFMNQGITTKQDNGNILVYFTQPGVTFDDLRKESSDL